MSSRNLLACCLLALLTPLVAAAALPPSAGPLAESAAEVLSVPFPQGLPAAPGVEWSEAVVRIYADGNLLATEHLEVRRPAASEIGRLQVLATRPEEAATLAGMIERGRVRVEVSLEVDGSVVAHLPGERLLQKAAPAGEAGRGRLLDLRYLAAGDAPAGLERITAAGLDCSARLACTEQCNQQYRDCIDSGVCFPQLICAECENQLDACFASCPECTCTEPKRVTTETRTYFVNAYYTGAWQCYEETFEYDYQDGIFHEEYVRVYRQDEVQITEACNGDKSEQVLSSTYVYAPCWVPNYLGCSFPFSKAYPTC